MSFKLEETTIADIHDAYRAGDSLAPSSSPAISPASRPMTAAADAQLDHHGQSEGG